MFSYFSKYLSNKKKEQSFDTDNYSVRIDIVDENLNIQNFSNVFDICDIEEGKTSAKTLFTNDEWEQVSKAYINSFNKQQFISQLFNEVNRRKKVLKQFDI